MSNCKDRTEKTPIIAPLRSREDFATKAVFSLPKPTAMHIAKRMLRNLNYYQTNYALTCAIICFVVLLLNPGFLMILLLVLSGWYYVLIVRDGLGPLKIGDKYISPSQQRQGMLIASAAISVLTGYILVALGTVALCLIAVVGHSVFRKPNLKNKLSNFAEDVQQKRTVFTHLLDKLIAYLEIDPDIDVE